MHEQSRHGDHGYKHYRLLALMGILTIAAMYALTLAACGSTAGGGVPVYHRPSTGQGSR